MEGLPRDSISEIRLTTLLMATMAHPSLRRIRSWHESSIRRNTDRAHTHARQIGVSRPLYALVRLLLTPILRLWFRVRISGAEHLPAQGAAIIAANHKGFLDPFFVAMATRRHLRYMAKAELFRAAPSWLLVRLGAFPVRRGAADADALETARVILSQGGLIVIFPEGTRVAEADVLGSPHHGAGRLALETGTPIVPVAIAGTSRLWFSPIPKLRRVQVAFLAPVDVVDVSSARDALSQLIDVQVWPAVQREYGRLLARPGPTATALAAIGIGGLLAGRHRRTRRKPRIRLVAPHRRSRPRWAVWRR
jgi:1-acyl-sn-glycerol-3-phosphate acyltransferase